MQKYFRDMPILAKEIYRNKVVKDLKPGLQNGLNFNKSFLKDNNMNFLGINTTNPENQTKWLTYLFLDKMHDLVGGDRIKWSNSYSHIIRFSLMGTLLRGKELNVTNIPYFERDSDKKIMKLLKTYDTGKKCESIDPDKMHKFLFDWTVSGENKFNLVLSSSETEVINMVRPDIEEKRFHYGSTDTSLLKKYTFNEGKIHILRGFEKSEEPGGYLGLQESMLESNPTFRNTTETDGRQLSRESYAGYFWDNFKEFVIDSTKKGGISEKFGGPMGADAHAHFLSRGPLSGILDPSIYRSPERPEFIKLNELDPREVYKSPFIYPLFCLPGRKSKEESVANISVNGGESKSGNISEKKTGNGGWIFLRTRKKGLTSEEIKIQKQYFTDDKSNPNPMKDAMKVTSEEAKKYESTSKKEKSKDDDGEGGTNFRVNTVPDESKRMYPYYAT